MRFSERLWIAGVLAGLTVAGRIFIAVPHPRTAAIAPIALAWGVASAAGVLLVIAALEYAVRRTHTTLAGNGAAMMAFTVAAAIGVATAVGLAVGAGPASSYALLGSLIVGGATWFTVARGMSSPAATAALALAAFALLTVCRETGTVGIRWMKGTYERAVHARHTEQCTSDGMEGTVSSAMFRPSYVISTKDVAGNVGELLPDEYAPKPGRDVYVVVDGSAELDDWLCHLPLFKRAEMHVDLDARYTYVSRSGEVSCWGSTSLAMDLTLQQLGISSCRDLRESAAEQIIGGVDERMRVIFGH